MKKGSKYVLYSVLAILFCYIYANVDKMHTIYDTSIDTAKYQSVVIEDNNKISQSFYCREKELSGVAVKILVGNTEDTGSVFYSLNDENKKTLVSGELPISDIKNQKINIIKFNNTVSTKEGKLYTISFSKKQTKIIQLAYILYRMKSQMAKF